MQGKLRKLIKIGEIESIENMYLQHGISLTHWRVERRKIYI